MTAMTTRTEHRPTPGPSISFITLGVADLSRSRAFYERLGFREHARSNEHVAFYDLGGQVLALYPRIALAEDAGVDPAPPESGIDFSLSRNVAAESDVQAFLDRAEEAGGRITRKASPPPWGGLRGYFSDPDGFAWEIAWNPVMRLDVEGRIHFND